MKKALSLLIAALFVMGMSAETFAAKKYISGNVGMAWFDDATATQVEGDEDDTVDLSFDSGIALTGAIGCDFGSTRIEAEMGYQKNDVKSITFDYVEFLDPYEPPYISERDRLETEEGTGDVSLTTFMLNGYYDITPMEGSGVEIFLTAGVGAVFVHFDSVGPGIDMDETYDVVDDYTSTFSETTWAYQLGAGVAIPVGDGIMVDARYRYFDAADITTRDDDELFVEDPMNISIDSHSALLGLRYSF